MHISSLEQELMQNWPQGPFWRVPKPASQLKQLRQTQSKPSSPLPTAARTGVFPFGHLPQVERQDSQKIWQTGLLAKGEDLKGEAEESKEGISFTGLWRFRAF